MSSRRLVLGCLVVVVACGPPLRIHPDPERGCADVALAGQDDVAVAAGCRTLDSLDIRTGMELDLTPLRQLREIRGAFSVGPTVGLAELSLPRLTSAGSIRIVANGNLMRLALPVLERSSKVEIEGNGALSIVALPALRSTDRISIADNAELEVVDLSALTSIRELALHENPKLTLVEATKLREIEELTLERLPALPDDQAAPLRTASGH